MDGDDRLIAALVDQGQAWDLVGPHGQAIQRDDDGRDVVLLMATREDAESIAREWYVGDEPRACGVEETLLLLERLVKQDEGALVDAGARPADGALGSWRVPAQVLLSNLLQALERAGRSLDGDWQPTDPAEVLNLDTSERYQWFLTWVAADEGAWALGNETSFMTFPYDEGNALVLWPHASFARSWSKENDAEELKLYRLRWDKLLSELKIAQKAGEGVAVFPGSDGQSTVLHPETLRIDLEQEREHLRAEDRGQTSE